MDVEQCAKNKINDIDVATTRDSDSSNEMIATPPSPTTQSEAPNRDSTSHAIVDTMDTVPLSNAQTVAWLDVDLDFGIDEDMNISTDVTNFETHFSHDLQDLRYTPPATESNLLDMFQLDNLEQILENDFGLYHDSTVDLNHLSRDRLQGEQALIESTTAPVGPKSPVASYRRSPALQALLGMPCTHVEDIPSILASLTPSSPTLSQANL